MSSEYSKTNQSREHEAEFMANLADVDPYAPIPGVHQGYGPARNASI